MSAAGDDELRSVVRRCLAGAEDGRRFAATEDRPAAIDQSLWHRLAAEIGVSALLVPSELGGSGGRFSDLAGVLTEAGGTLAPVPLLSTAGFAVPVLRSLATPAADGVMSRLSAGSTTASSATVAWADPGDVAIGGDLNGEAATGPVGCVIDAASADILLLVTAEQVFEVDPDLVRRRPMVTLDLTRSMAQLEMEGVPVVALGTVTAATLDLPLVALAAEQVGVAARILDDAVTYAKERAQFGRVIGSFQAVKHKLADLLLEVEIGRALLVEAVVAADRFLADRTPEKARALSVAAATVAGHCGDMATHVSREALHVFGGIGFTWEHHAHMYFRRAKTDEVLLGHPARHRRRLSRQLGLPVAS